MSLSFHLVPPRFDEGTTSSKNKLAFCQQLQPFASVKTMRSSAVNYSLCSTEGGLRSTSHRQVPKLALNVSDLKRGSSKRKKSEKGNTFRHEEDEGTI